MDGDAIQPVTKVSYSRLVCIRKYILNSMICIGWVWMLPGQLRNIEIWKSRRTLDELNQGLDHQKGAD